MKYLLFLSLIISSSFSLFAQGDYKVLCYFDEGWNSVSEDNPNIKYIRDTNSSNNSIIYDRYYPSLVVQFEFISRSGRVEKKICEGSSFNDLAKAWDAGMYKFYDDNGNVEHEGQIYNGTFLWRNVYKGQNTIKRGWRIDVNKPFHGQKTTYYSYKEKSTNKIEGTLNKDGYFHGDVVIGMTSNYSDFDNATLYHGKFKNGKPKGDFKKIIYVDGERFKYFGKVDNKKEVELGNKDVYELNILPEFSQYPHQNH